MNPYIHAVLAGLYIVAVVFVMSTFVDVPALEGTLLLPIAMLSLLVLSVTMMAFLFGYKPFQLYFDNRKQEALSFFVKTVLTFSCLVAAYIIVLLIVAAR
jgi:hypothetical protein